MTNKKVTDIKSTNKKPRQKKITLKQIRKEFEDVNKLSTYVINEEKNEVIKYYSKFDINKVQELLTKCHQHMNYAKEKNIEYFRNDKEFILFINYLTIIQFTHFGDEVSLDAPLEDHIQAMNALIGKGYFNLILNDIFDGNEVYSVVEYMKEYLEGANAAMQAELKEKEKFERMRNAKV